LRKSVLKLISFLFIALMVFSATANAAPNNDQIYRNIENFENSSGLDMATLFPEASPKLQSDWEKMYEDYTIVKVQKTEMFYQIDSDNKLVPMTVGQVKQNTGKGQIGTMGVGSNTNYGITVYVTTAKSVGGSSYPTEWLLGGSFQWNNTPNLDAGKSVDAFVIGWHGGLAIKQNSTSGVVHYNKGDTYPAVVTITPNAGVGWEFNEAIDKTWPAGNWYAESGSFAVSIIKNTTNAGNIANAIAQYNQSYDTKNVTSLGLSLSATGGGFSIGWTNTTKVNTIPAYTDFTY